MNIFSLSDVGISLVHEPLFENVTLGIEEGEKIGLVGRNGSGKTTFLRMLQGELSPDSGDFSRNSTVTLGSLVQRPGFQPDMTLDEFFCLGKGPLIELARAYEECARSIHDLPNNEAELARLTERMEREGGFTAEQSYRSFCRELGLTDISGKMGTLSGGMVRKAALARTLASGASFYTLDEPTNHLDLDTIEWLETKLKTGNAGFVLVTHDRSFLDSVCTSIIEIDKRRVYKYEGNYSVYLEKKAARKEIAERAEQRRSAVLKRELEWLKRGPKARTGKDKGRKARIQDLLDAEVRKEAEMNEFSSSHRRLGKKILELDNISKVYDRQVVVKPFTYSFKKGERIGIIGPNGSGKTTFLDLIEGRVSCDSGGVTAGVNTRFAYLDQAGHRINGDLTVLDYIKEEAERIETEDGSVSAEQFLERFLFSRPMFSQPLRKLSGGEFRRLYLIRTLASSPNFLLLDEPTNDLDIDTIRLLEEFLLAFPGCILLVSHDRTLLERITDYLFVFDGSGGIKGFSGDYLEYKVFMEEAEKERGGSRAREKREKPERKAAGLTFNEKREYESLLDEIGELEKEKEALESVFARISSDPGELEKDTRRYKELTGLIDEKTSRWEELADRG